MLVLTTDTVHVQLSHRLENRKKEKPEHSCNTQPSAVAVALVFIRPRSCALLKPTAALLRSWGSEGAEGMLRLAGWSE